MADDRIWVLLGKKKTGEASADELQELQRLLSAMDNPGYANEIIDKIWTSPLSSLPGIELTDDNWRKIENEIEPKSNKIIHLPFAKHRKWIAAASVVIVAGISLMFYLQSRRDNSVAGVTEKKINHILTQPGSKSKIELPDGTQVWLNGNSQLAYGSNFGAQSRDVTLTGEAFFDVVTSTSPRTGDKIPFIIHTGTITITVKGTAFNVKAYPQEKVIEASLVRGLIEISTQQDPDRKILLKPNEKIIIPVDGIKKETAGTADASIYTITSLHKNKSQAIPETVWMQPKLEFDNESLDELAPKMEHWFNIKIHFVNEEMKSKHFSGVIEKETLKETLEAMQLSYHFNYRVKENELWIDKK